MKDILGNELKNGDKIVFAHAYYGQGYYLTQGTVVGFTPKNVRVNFKAPYCGTALSEETIKSPVKCAKVTIDTV